MKLGAIFAVLLGFTATTTSAATLDFTEVGATGIVPQTVINLSNATITSFGDDTFIGAPGQFGEANNLGIVCGSPVGSNNCEEGMQIDFLADVSNLMFSSFAAVAGDNVLVEAFLNGGLLGSAIVTTDTMIDFSGFGLIDSLVFTDSSTSAGIGFGDFKFDETGGVIPLPATLPLMLGALALMGFAGSRRRS